MKEQYELQIFTECETVYEKMLNKYKKTARGNIQDVTVHIFKGDLLEKCRETKKSVEPFAITRPMIEDNIIYEQLIKRICDNLPIMHLNIPNYILLGHEKSFENDDCLMYDKEEKKYILMIAYKKKLIV